MRCGAGFMSVVLACSATLSLAQDNLVPNPGFNQDISGWTLSAPSRLPFARSWSPADRLGNPASGSIHFEYSHEFNFGLWSMDKWLGTSVCIRLDSGTDVEGGGTVIETGAWSLMPSGQPQGARPGIVLFMYTDMDCTQPTDEWYEKEQWYRDQWILTSIARQAPPGTQSISLFLGLHHPGITRLGVFQGNFDDAFVRVRPFGANTLNPSLSVPWYNPDQSGHGVMLNLLDAEHAWMCWFTFDLAGAPAWFCGLGTANPNTAHNQLLFADVFTVEGGRFPPGFDPDAAAMVSVGELSLTFTGCDDALMQWLFYLPDQDGAETVNSGSMIVKRLFEPWNSDCEADPVAASRAQGIRAPQPGRGRAATVVLSDGDFTLNPSLTAAWYDPAHPGHGIMLNMLDPDRAWMCWFTFDSGGSPAWICGLGTANANRDALEFAEAFTVTGGEWADFWNPASVAEATWGSIAITFAGCNDATMTWTTNQPGFQSGAMPLKRLLNTWGTSCG